MIIGIGQGPVAWTPLQAAIAYARLAADGAAIRPVMVRSDEGTSPDREASVGGDWNRVAVTTALDGMRASATGGTAATVRVQPDRRERLLDFTDLAGAAPTVWAKTGTAQVGRERRREGEQEILGWDTTQDHAWFAAYAPAEDPEIVVVALVAHGGAGADAAAPIVMRVIGDSLGGRRAGSRDRTVSPARRSAGVPPPLPGAEEARR